MSTAARGRALWLGISFWLGLVAGAGVGLVAAVDARHRVGVLDANLSELQASQRLDAQRLLECQRRVDVGTVLAELQQENFGTARRLVTELAERLRVDEPKLADELEALVIEPGGHDVVGERLATLFLVRDLP